MYYDEECSRLATPAEAAREYAHNAGAEERGREWILTPWDSWERNPFYTGPRGRHPEDDYADEPGEDYAPSWPHGPLIDDEIPF